MTGSWSISLKLTTVLVAVLVVTGVAAVVLLQSELEEMSDRQSAQLGGVLRGATDDVLSCRLAEFEGKLEASRKEALSMAATFARLPVVAEAYRIAHEGDLTDEADPKMQEARELLRRALLPQLEGFERVAGRGPLNLHFHVPPARSLVRLWREKQCKRAGEWVDVSDDLRSFRNSVIDVNKNRKPVQGIEVGRGGFAIRALLPIERDGKHLGSCEVLMPFLPLLEGVAREDGEIAAVWMDARLLPIATKMQDRGKNPLLGTRYVLCASSDRQVTDPLFAEGDLDAGRDGRSLFDKTGYRIATVPIRDYSDACVGVLAVGRHTGPQQAAIAAITQETRDQSARTSWKLSLGILIACAAIVLVAYKFTGLVVSRPVRGLAASLRMLAQGKGDLTVALPVRSKDEIGELARDFNAFLASMGTLIDGIKQESRKLTTASQGLNALAGAMSQHASAASQDAEQVHGVVSTLSGEISEVSKSTRDIAENIVEVGNSARRASEVADAAVQSSGQARDCISRLEETSTQIDAVVKTIAGIAEQTNLLALNATIEAARAGAHGKGFAVVAGEVKDLAREAGEASAQIVARIQEIQGDIKVASGSVDEIVATIGEVHGIQGGIAEAAGRQESGTNAISHALEELSQRSEQIAQLAATMSGRAQQSDDGATRTREGATELLRGVKAIDDSIGHFKT